MNRLIQLLARMTKLPQHLRKHAMADMVIRAREVLDDYEESAKYDGFTKQKNGSWKVK